MLAATKEMLMRAQAGGYAVGAFNVYNMEGALAVIAAAVEAKSPVILQILPKALEIGGGPLLSLCLQAGRDAHVPVAVHLDHCSSKKTIVSAISAGFSSVMADGSHLNFSDNIEFTRRLVEQAHAVNVGVEAELGRISGEEDGVNISNASEMMTRVSEADVFVEETGLDALAVCIGNVHGRYNRVPVLDFKRLADIAKAVTVPLVLHGTSGLPDDLIRQSMSHGVCKFNVNTEIRQCYLQELKNLSCLGGVELVEVMQGSIKAMKIPVLEKILLFGSDNKAEQ